ncbi:MAG: S8 family serine peptidase [Propionibacteriaceae bacterium]|nr:S8 family serine peptidase [Propionibacteriaceae bacterium]
MPQKAYRAIVLFITVALGLGGLVPSAQADQPGPDIYPDSVGQAVQGAKQVPILSPDSATLAADDTAVSLITGDVVHLSAGKVTGVTPAQRRDETPTSYSTSSDNSNVYVIPSDVAALVGRQLDRELFNVTKLASYGLTAGSPLPVIITGADSSPAPSAGQLSALGVTATTKAGLSFQAAQVDTTVSQDPAAVWALLDDLSTGAAPGSAISTQTKVWLDQKVHLADVTPSASPSTTSPGAGKSTTPAPAGTPSGKTSATPTTGSTTTKPATTRPGTPAATSSSATPTPSQATTSTPAPTASSATETPSATATATPAADDAPPWMTLIGADQAHNQGYTGEGVRVAVVDTGIDDNHPDLAGQVIAAEDFTGSGSPIDENGHGTFVASEIAGTGAASSGYYVGVAPGAKLINARGLDADGNGDDSTIMAAMQWAAEQGADIINMSLGDSGTYDDGTSPLSQLINQLSDQYGCLFVNAVGNDGVPQSINSPSTADEALSVAAVLDDESPAWFSSAGPRRGDGAVKPEILAPGGHASPDGDGDPPVVGLVGAQAGSDGYDSTEYGTSMAAPLVAGAAALLKQADPGLDRTDIRARLMASARLPISAVGAWADGSGIVDIPAALTQTLTTSPTQLNFGAQALPYPTSVTKTLTYVNDGDADVTFTLDADLSSTPILGLPTSSDPQTADAARVSPPSATPAAHVFSRSLADLPPGIDLSARSVTVPAHGTASVDVTIDPSAFPTSYPDGYIIAMSADTVLRTPLGWANSPQTYTVTASFTDRNGDPASGLNMVALMALDTDDMIYGTSDPVQTFTVMSGRYVVTADDLTVNPLGGIDTTVFLSPTLTIDSDTSVTLDGTTAQPFTVKTDRPLQGDGLGLWTMAQDSADTTGAYFPSPQDSFGADTMYITPVADQTWSVDVGGGQSGPTVLAALGSCGQPAVTLAPVNTAPAGLYHWTGVDVPSLDMPAATSDQMAAIVSSNEQPASITADALPQWATAAHQAGYAALIVDSDQPSQILRDAAWMLDGVDFDLPVFVTTTQTGDQLRALGSQRTINVLVREGSEYGYLLLQGMPLGQEPITLDATDANTASITVQHRAMGPNDTWSDDVMVMPQVPVDPSPYLAEREGFWKGVTSRTYYVTADSFVTVSTQPSSGDDQGSPLVEVLGQTLMSAGQHVSATVGTQVHSAALSPESPLIRSDNQIVSLVPGMIDGLGQPVALDLANPNTVDVTLTKLAASPSGTDEVLFSTQDPDDIIDAENLDPGLQTYRLDETTTADPAYWSLSTSVSTSWTWRSEVSDDTRTEPLRQVWYELPGLDADNAGSVSQPIILHVGTQPGAVAVSTNHVILSMSTDGGTTWADVPVTLTAVAPDGSIGAVSGETLYTGTIPAAVGQTVSLRSHVDGDGSQWDQSVTSAYTVTDTPRPMTTSWVCPAWTEAAFTQANATDIAGTATPTMELTIIDANGQILGQVTADDTGHWSMPTPAGTPSQQITLVSYPGPTPEPKVWATTDLDTDSPAAPVITSPVDGTVTNQDTPVITGTGTEPGATITVSDSFTRDSTTDNGSSTAGSAPETTITGLGGALTPHTTTGTQPSTSGGQPDSSLKLSTSTSGWLDIIQNAGPTTITVCTATVQNDLSWTCAPSTPLVAAVHTLTATQTDQAGNISDPSGPVHLRITAPIKAMIHTGGTTRTTSDSMSMGLVLLAVGMLTVALSTVAVLRRRLRATS